MAEQQVGKIVEIGIEDELSRSYGRYAQTIILDRAIPDARDGLKPVQRRILYAMGQSRNTPDGPYRKAAKTVGDVMGNYHPHGDSSIYDALVRLAQPWKMRLLLVDGHGNFGSVDDDPAAAMRYTEARLAPAAMELLQDIDKDTVEWRPNFDESTLEPVVLPAAYPNLLVNGTSGVSTGFATEIPPHNLREVAAAVELRLGRPDCTLDELMAVLPGPDFPTGGILMGAEGLRQAYETGRGKVTLRARHREEKGDGGKRLIVVDQLPYGVVKANLVRDMDALRQGRSVQGILDTRDESDREGLRVVIELSKTADVEGVWAYLLKKTDLQVTYAFNMVAIAGHRPLEGGLVGLLDAWIGHRREVVRRRSEHDLAKARDRRHLVEGLIRAVDVLDEVIATIRASRDRADARANLIARFSFSEAQAEAILELRLHRLTGLQIHALRDEFAALSKEIARLETLLAKQERMDRLIAKELRDVAERLGDDRRTEIRAAVETLAVALEVRVKPQQVLLVVTDRGYIKRSSFHSFQASGGQWEGAGARSGDFPRFLVETNTTHRVLVFTALGNVHAIPVHTLPDARWGDPGVALVNVVPFEMQEDQVVAVLSPDAFAGHRQLLFVTAEGFVKRTALDEFDLRRSGGAVATKLQGKDRVVAVLECGGDEDVILATASGQTIRFPVDQVSVQGRTAKGVRGMGVNHKDRIAAATFAPPLPAVAEGASPAAGDAVEVAVFTSTAKAKKTPLAMYPRQHRGGKGVQGLVQRGKRPHEIVAIAVAERPDDTFLLFLADDTSRRLTAEALRTTRRDGNAFQLPDLAETATVRAVIALPRPPAEEPARPAGEPEPTPAVAFEVPPAAAAPLPRTTQLELLPGGGGAGAGRAEEE
jgi:topoisomerase-4 subunit A